MDKPRFVEDIYPRHTLCGLTIRSPLARGRLQSLECPKLPGSYTLITASDIPGKNRLENSDMPILAGDRLSYIGEPVALLLGPDRTMLEEYAAQCTVIAEAETPVFAAHAVVDDAVLARREIRAGDPEAAFARAASIMRGDYRTGIQEHWYAEPVGAVAWLETDNAGGGEGGKHSGKTLVVHTATQWPFHVKRSVAQVLKMESALVRVQSAFTGLHMDGKIWYPSLIACHAALGAWITKKPVRFILTREEDFRYSPKRNGSEISVSSALDAQGEIIGSEIQVTVNLGAYGINSAEILDQTCLGSLGVYRFDNLKLSGAAVRTNIPPQGPFCGFGLAQGFFALERHLSHVADTRKHNPAEWRKNRFPGNGSLPLGPAFKESAPGEQLLDTAAAMSDYYRKWASYELLRQERRQRLARNSPRNNWADKGETLRGIGIALGYQANGMLYPGADKGNYAIELTLGKDASLEIATSTAGYNDYGRIWAAMAQEILSIDAGAVRIINNAASPDSGPACASRNISVLTRLVEQACLAIRKQRFRDPLPIRVRKTVRPRTSPLWEERFPPLEGAILDAAGFSRPGWASAVVEVEVDPVEYIPRIRGVWMGVDGGKILSEERARRSLKISTVQALGWAFREQIAYSDGVLSWAQFANYDIPSPGEIPSVHIDFIWNDTNEPKGIGDLPFCCVPAAYVHAVSQAMDHHFQSIPLTREDIWEAGKLKKTEEP
ncbi:MAG: xanthine dehydrogenase family protein molybdopterin-binding subunit [Treponema sp.]|jgi:CO/xanthine dehydrogenase Mo-binding subunit|nr:xanthine dehydrogenase family protein molybdopterin-binding subunit [Treponema sp.]